MSLEENISISRPRDLTLELYRVLLMYGICVLHCITQGGIIKFGFRMFYSRV